MYIKTRFEEMQAVYLIEQDNNNEWYVSSLCTIQGICIIVKNGKVKITYSIHKTANNDFTVFNGLKEYHLFDDKEKACDKCQYLNEKQAKKAQKGRK